MCQISTLAEAMAVDCTVFERRPRGSGGIVSELLLEVAIQLKPFSHHIVYTTQDAIGGGEKVGSGLRD